MFKTIRRLIAPIAFLAISVASPFVAAQSDLLRTAPVAATASTVDAANAKGLTPTCFCNFTCGGVSRSTTFPGTFPQQLAGNQQKCKAQCENWIGGSMPTWAAEAGAAKACPTFQCGGNSTLGTSPPRAISNTIDTSNMAMCKRPDGGGNACCPEFTKAAKIQPFFTEGVHVLGQPYTMTFDSTSNASNQMETAFSNWSKWLKADGCSGVVGFKIIYTLYNTNSTVKPTSGSAVPAGSVAVGTPVTVSYINGVVGPASFVWNVPASPNWWYVGTSVVPIGANGQVVTCAKTSDCFGKFYTGWIDDALSSARVANPGKAPGRIRFLD